MKIVFAGTIGRSGLGGQAWAGLQYLLGFRALGHDVIYLEDCGVSSWVYNWEQGEWTTDLSYPAAYVHACLAPFGLGGRWIYRTDAGSAGMPLEDFRQFCADADLLVMRAVPLWVWRREYDGPCRRAFIDVDPGFTQISIAQGDKGLAGGVQRCERRFTYGQRIGAPDCSVPLAGGPWLTTLPPVYPAEWPVATGKATHFTSVIRWRGFREAEHEGITYGQRDKEFPKFLDLPRLSARPFRIAQLGTQPETLEDSGWEVVSGETVSRTPAAYREFIQNSVAEFSVPKAGYVKMRGGWFSDRSVCYLASGRPVLIEDTGLSDWLPVGAGVLTFRDLPEALTGVRQIDADYEQQRRSARQLAEGMFATDRVLPGLLKAAMS